MSRRSSRATAPTAPAASSDRVSRNPSSPHPDEQLSDEDDVSVGEWFALLRDVAQEVDLQVIVPITRTAPEEWFRLTCGNRRRKALAGLTERDSREVALTSCS